MTDDETYFYDERIGDVRIQVWRQAEHRPWFVTFLPDHKPGQRPASGRTYTPDDRDIPPGYPESNDPGELRDWAKNYAERQRFDS